MAFGDRGRTRGTLFGAPGVGVVQPGLRWSPRYGAGMGAGAGLPYRTYLPSVGGGAAWQPTYGDWGWQPGGSFGRALQGVGTALGQAGAGAYDLARTVAGRAGGGVEGPGWTTWGERFGNPAEGGAADVPGGGRSTTTGGRWANNAPAGVDQKWWDDFTEEHDGQNPLDYYGAQGEGLAEAMGDLEWSQGFERDHGRPPNDDEWRWWWFEKRGLNRPRQQAAPKEEEEPRPPLWIPPQVVWRQS